jgi:hypothetical protein
MRSAAVTASRRNSKMLIFPGAKKAVTVISAQSSANPVQCHCFLSDSKTAIDRRRCLPIPG